MGRLLDDITAEAAPPNPRCPVALALRNLGEVDQADLITALNDSETYSAVAITKALRKREYHLSDRAIGRHRRRECACR